MNYRSSDKLIQLLYQISEQALHRLASDNRGVFYAAFIKAYLQGYAPL